MTKQMEAIIETICECYGFTVDELLTKKRSERAVKARHIAIRLARDLIYPRPSLVSIGRQLGGRDHSTIVNSLKREFPAEAIGVRIMVKEKLNKIQNTNYGRDALI